MAKTNPIGVRFKQEVLDYVKKEHGIESPQKALVFYERFFVQHSALAKDITQVLRDKTLKPIVQEELQTKISEKKAEVVAQQENKPVIHWQPDNSHILARIEELEKEIKSPPKSPQIGLKMWLQIRQSEINQLKKQLNQ